MINLNQKGYIGLVIISFLIVLSMVLYPWKFPKSDSAGCRVGQAVDLNSPETVMLPPIKNVGIPNPSIGPPVNGGWDEEAAPVEYVLIRKNAPIFTFTTDPEYKIGYPDWMGKSVDSTVKWPIIADIDFLGNHADTRHTLKYANANKSGFDVYYPNQGGEMDLDKTVLDSTGTSTTWLNIRTEGLLLFVHLDAEGKAVKINYGQHIYYLVDFYQDRRLFQHGGYEVDDLFHCLDKLAPAATAVTVPDQEVSQHKDQLQLEWFKFEGAPGMSAHCKPAVYLYPEKKQLVNVKVYPKGELYYTDPPYDKENGWTVEAFPNGNLFNLPQRSGIEQGYLYYESKLLDSEIKKPSQGWVIQQSEMENLFNDILPKLGLNEKEEKDFKDYWLTKLPESPYYFVGVIEKDQRDYLEKLDVTPKPETSIRFSLFFEMLDQPKEVEEPIIQTPKRNGFTLVDWGGMMKLHPGTAFTCSQ